MIEGVLRKINNRSDLDDIISLKNDCAKTSNSIIDEYDISAYYVMIYDSKKPIGYGRLYTHSNNNILDCVNLIEEAQDDNYKDLIVRMLIHKGFSLNFYRTITYCMEDEVSFYKRIGFMELGETCVFDDITFEGLYIEESMVIKCCD